MHAPQGNLDNKLWDYFDLECIVSECLTATPPQWAALRTMIWNYSAAPQLIPDECEIDLLRTVLDLVSELTKLASQIAKLPSTTYLVTM